MFSHRLFATQGVDGLPVTFDGKSITKASLLVFGPVMVDVQNFPMRYNTCLILMI